MIGGSFASAGQLDIESAVPNRLLAWQTSSRFTVTRLLCYPLLCIVCYRLCIHIYIYIYTYEVLDCVHETHLHNRYTLTISARELGNHLRLVCRPSHFRHRVQGSLRLHSYTSGSMGSGGIMHIDLIIYQPAARSVCIACWQPHTETCYFYTFYSGCQQS